MPPSPSDWNVILLGAWNLAILTPDGISRRLFELEPGTPLEIQVPITGHGQAPIRVIHSGLVVEPTSGRLSVTPQEPTEQGLRDAVAVAGKALESLPETPVSAAGINIRYKFDTVPDELVTIQTSTIDDQLAVAGSRIRSRALERALEWNEGVINLTARSNGDGSALLSLNFHRDSLTGPDLLAWLRRVDEMLESAANFMGPVLGLTGPGEGG